MSTTTMSTTTYITSLIPEHWGDHPITAGTVAVLTEYARQGVSHATLAALAEGIEAAVDEAQHGTRLENRENFPETISAEEVTI